MIRTTFGKILILSFLILLFIAPAVALSTFAASPTSLSIVKTIKTGPHSHPQGIAYDSKDQKIFVVEQGGAVAPVGNVSVISTITKSH
jgi:DNA-binding beta-propeller fold protein YncE